MKASSDRIPLRSVAWWWAGESWGLTETRSYAVPSSSREVLVRAPFPIPLFPPSPLWPAHARKSKVGVALSFLLDTIRFVGGSVLAVLLCCLRLPIHRTYLHAIHRK